MSDFHLKAELPPDATAREVTEIRAKAFQAALNHAATDPAITLKMLVGAAGNEYRTTTWMLAHKICKAGPEVIALARKLAAEPGVIGSHQKVLEDAMPQVDEFERVWREQGHLPG